MVGWWRGLGLGAGFGGSRVGGCMMMYVPAHAHSDTGCEISDTSETLNETTHYIIQDKQLQSAGHSASVFTHTYNYT